MIGKLIWGMIKPFYSETINQAVREELLKIAKEMPETKIKLSQLTKDWLPKLKDDKTSFDCIYQHAHLPIQALDIRYILHFGAYTKEQTVSFSSYSELYDFCKKYSEEDEPIWQGKERVDGVSEIKVCLWYTFLEDRHLQHWYLTGVLDNKIYYVQDFKKILSKVSETLDNYPELLLK